MKGIIYCLRNTKNNKMYVGQSTRSLKTRWREHLRTNNTYISNMLKTEGAENFEKFVLFEVETETKEELFDILQEKEQFFIDTLKTMENGYNKRCSAKNHCNRSKNTLQIELARKNLTGEGVMNKGAKLSEEDVVEIRRSAEHWSVLAEKFKVSRRTIYRVRNNEVYKNIN